MPKNSPKISETAKIIIYTLVFLLLTLSVYFFFLLWPKVASIKKVGEVKTNLEEARLTLSENKILFYRYLTFDPTSLTFYEDKETLMIQLQEAQKKSDEYFSKSPKKIGSGIFATNGTRKIVSEINEANPVVYEKAKASLKDQKKIAEELTAYDKTYGKLLEYQPILDLSNFENKDMTLERAETAVVEITKIKVRINSSEVGGKEAVSKEIDNALSSLEAFKSALQSGNDTLAVARLNALENAYKKLKSRAFETQTGVVKSESSLAALAYEDEALTQLEDLIEKSTEVQKDLSNDPLYNLLSFF